MRLARHGSGGYGGHSLGGVEVIGFHRAGFGLDEQTRFGLSVFPDGSVLQPNMTSNPAIAPRLQSTSPVGRVAELGSLGSEAHVYANTGAL